MKMSGEVEGQRAMRKRGRLNQQMECENQHDCLLNSLMVGLPGVLSTSIYLNKPLEADNFAFYILGRTSEFVVIFIYLQKNI